MSDGLRSLSRRIMNRETTQKTSREHFWALKDVSFEIRQGERVGVIGKNGAGKSTLLKILSRITDPTLGKVAITGRVASLLEVGTGFHPELTGRENIFLNGAILGMAKTEIQRKFDDIVAFAEVERFLDTPVKYYSSGMYVRLAFSVAAQLEAEILIVDEVLAVGDIEFQKKCLGRMGEISASGRTVLFVSHNMATITSLCSRCILLDAGTVKADGDPSDVVLKYYTGGASSPAIFDPDVSNRTIGDNHARLISAQIADSSGRVIHELDIGEAFNVSMQYRILDSVMKNVPNFHFFRADGTCAFTAIAPNVQATEPGDYIATCKIPPHFLNDGSYFVGLALTSFGQVGLTLNFYEQSALSFNVRDPMNADGIRYGYGGPMPGVVRPIFAWRIERMG
ncbi:MAG TPA: ABC transporter ATP-binding protein [Burkholderiales bacterium]|nr:ABC transporter ATP-binding protein [Burkholderiales bacterium]